MRVLLLRTLFCVLVLMSAIVGTSQVWESVSPSSLRTDNARQLLKPQKFSLQKTNSTQLLSLMKAAPLEFSNESRLSNSILQLPMPDGSLKRFKIFRSPVMAPELAASYPQITTYTAQGIDDPYAVGRLDFNPYFGFHAMILSPNGTFFIDPYERWNTEYYMSYYKKDFRKDLPYYELPPVSSVEYDNYLSSRVQAAPCRGPQLYSYRLALACTGEYSVAVTSPATPTIATVLAAMVTSVNRVDGVYESELGVRMVLVPNDTLLIYLNAAGDPYNNNNGSTMLGQNQTNIDAVIGAPNYDIGHVFSTGGGGIAGLGVVCRASNKARGVTGSSNPVGDPYDIDYVAHEMGHQFGGNHTFNSVTSNCGGGNRNGTTAYEVGSGTTIQAYAGICGTDDIQPHSDPFFHAISYDEIVNYIGTQTCHTTIATGNNAPSISSMSNNGANIPLGTPFTLTGAATDPDGDAITYCWEEWDLGASSAWNGGAASTTIPLFKSRVPVTSGSRTIPDINVILAGYPANPSAVMGGLKGETLPTVARAMKFRLTVRDNKAGGGGVTSGGSGCQTGFTSTFQVNTIAGTGPFVVTAPNGGEVWSGGGTQTVTWNVASTDLSPISCANVDIVMSTDGGLTYPTTVLSNTPNDGTQLVTVPNIPTNNTVRFKVRAAGNIFFDISDANFTINFNAALPVGFIDFTAAATERNVSLSWSTAFEAENSGYAIERSEGNADHFTQIGFVASRGNSNNTTNYSFTDDNVKKNVRYYYRLRQTDMGGHITYSVIRSVIIKSSALANVSVSPNPATDMITLVLNTDKIKSMDVLITDITGKKIRQLRLGNISGRVSSSINIRDLAKGTYLMRLQSGEDTETLKFIKL